jgi:hypothetical protein
MAHSEILLLNRCVPFRVGQGGDRTQNYGLIEFRGTATNVLWSSIGPTYTWGIVETTVPVPDLSLAPQLRISPLERSPAGDVAKITWTSFAGQHFTLQTATNIDSEFCDLQTRIRATPPYNTVTNDCNHGARFWRIVGGVIHRGMGRYQRTTRVSVEQDHGDG